MLILFLADANSAYWHIFSWLLIPVVLATIVGYPLWQWCVSIADSGAEKKLHEKINTLNHKAETAESLATDVRTFQARLSDAEDKHMIQHRIHDQLQADLTAAQEETKRLTSEFEQLKEAHDKVQVELDLSNKTAKLYRQLLADALQDKSGG